MHFTDPKDQAEFDAKHGGLGVLLCYPNEHAKSKMLLNEIRQALRERKILFLRKRQHEHRGQTRL